jgi:uncharacterized membrane protein YeaQ/YmgE (transglycosylase-associated protein family)
MKIAPSSYATDLQIRTNAKEAFEKGEKLILEGGGPHDEKAISNFLSSPDFQKNVAVGAGVGTAVGVVAGVVVDQITQAHPAAGILGKFFLGVIGGIVGGGIAAQEASDVARRTATGKAAAGDKVLYQAPAVAIDYDPRSGQLIARLMQQSAK